MINSSLESRPLTVGLDLLTVISPSYMTLTQYFFNTNNQFTERQISKLMSNK